MNSILNTISILSLINFSNISSTKCPLKDIDSVFYSVPKVNNSNYMKYVEKELVNMCDVPDPLSKSIYQHKKEKPGDIVDFIVVGAGAAGSVVASRLSEILNWKVALIEAGGSEPIGTQAPSMYFTYNKSPIDWDYPLKTMNSACLGKICKYPRGKVMGGTTILNGLMYCRGDSSDFEKLVELGCDGWSYKEVLPYFLKSENNLQYENSFNHKKGGLLTVSYYNDIPPFSKAIYEGAKELGYRTDIDIGHGELKEGFYRAQMTTRNGTRLSTAKAFIRPFLNRKNLHIIMNARVIRVLLNNKKQAYGVAYMKNNQMYHLYARKEVILSAGTIMSPVILLHSGIGPSDHLIERGVPAYINLPGVGKNLRNHVSYAVKGNLLKSEGYQLLNNQSLITYVNTGFGPMSSTGLSQVGAMIKIDDNCKIPNLQVFFAGLQARYSKTGSLLETDEYNKKFEISPTVLKTNSTGIILLEDNNPLRYPAIYPQYLKYDYEVESILKGIRFAQKLVSTNAMKNAGAVISPYIVKGCENHIWNTDNFWKCAIRFDTNPENHQVGTCKMGRITDPLAVVNPQLQVYGVSNLRVIDASIFPDIPSGNLMAPTIMVGEKGADIVKKYWES